jgi:hypothetical protein
MSIHKINYQGSAKIIASIVYGSKWPDRFCEDQRTGRGRIY